MLGETSSFLCLRLDYLTSFSVLFLVQYALACTQLSIYDRLAQIPNKSLSLVESDSNIMILKFSDLFDSSDFLASQKLDRVRFNQY